MTAPQRSGIALVICAPSGTGKTTLIKRLIAEFPHFVFSVSCTTRSPRQGERDGIDYVFLTQEEFLRRKETGYFAEWAEVHGNYYGTPLESTRSLLIKGRDVLFDIDVQGAARLRSTLPEARLIFILPPSRLELERRLRGRGSESPENLERRLAKAEEELAEASWFHTWIINDDLETAWRDLRTAYLAAGLTPACQTDFWHQLVREWGSEEKR